jgi:hypothetical protein
MTVLARAITSLSYPLNRVVRPACMSIATANWELRWRFKPALRSVAAPLPLCSSLAKAHSGSSESSRRRSSSESWATPSRRVPMKAQLGCDMSNAHFLRTRRRTSHCHQIGMADAPAHPAGGAGYTGTAPELPATRIYHEPQRMMLCGLHAVNAMVQARSSGPPSPSVSWRPFATNWIRRVCSTSTSTRAR